MCIGVQECGSVGVLTSVLHVIMYQWPTACNVTSKLLHSQTPKLLAKQSVEGINILFNALLSAINSP
jgi:hypothetical protein